MGASTWQWLLDHDPEGWTPKPTWVFTHRDFAASEQVRFTSADVRQVHARMLDAAGDKDVWLVGAGLTLLSQGIAGTVKSDAKALKKGIRKASPLNG